MGIHTNKLTSRFLILILKNKFKLAAKSMPAFSPLQGLGSHLALLPCASGKLVSFRESGVDVNGAKDFVHANAVLHGCDVFGNNVSGMASNDGHT